MPEFIDNTNDYVQYGAGLSTIIATVVAWCGALLAATARRTLGTEQGKSNPRRLPLRFSLAAIVKGWIAVTISTLSLAFLFFLVAGFVLFPSAEQNPNLPALPNPDQFPPQAQQEFRDSHDQVLNARKEFITAQMEKEMSEDRRWGVSFLILVGLGYVIGGYIAASRSRTVPLARIAHGLASIASFQVLANLALKFYFPDLEHQAASAAAIWQFVGEWELTTALVGAVLGALLASDYPDSS